MVLNFSVVAHFHKNSLQLVSTQKHISVWLKIQSAPTLYLGITAKFPEINTLDPDLYKYYNAFSGTSGPEKKTVMYLGNSSYSTNDTANNWTMYL